MIRQLNIFTPVGRTIFYLCLMFITAGCGGGGGGGGSSPSIYSPLPVIEAVNQSHDTLAGNAMLAGMIVQEGSGAARTSMRSAAEIEPLHIANAQPVAYANITVTPGNGDPIITRTDKNGAFYIAAGNLDNGTYNVSISSGEINDSFYMKIDGDSKQFLSEFTSSGAAHTRIIKQEAGKNWTRDIDPDGAWTIQDNGALAEEHFASGLTGIYRSDGTETWFIDDNANFTDDTTDPSAPVLSRLTDTDGDSCHNMRDFSDSDNDNDSRINNEDSDYNTNMLARNVHNMEEVNCIEDSRIYSIELTANPERGGAPLEVKAEVAIRGDISSIEKFEWITGQPGMEPIETLVPEVTITYNRYGAYVLIMTAHLTNGQKIIDTQPILVVNDSASGDVVYFKQFDAEGPSHTYTMDIDVDQYGNLFVLSEHWGTYDSVDYFNQVSIYDTGLDWMGNLELDTEYKMRQGTELISMDVDSNGFIYVLDTMAPTQIIIYNSMGERVDTIMLGDHFSFLDGGFLAVKGLGVAESGDIYFGFGGGSDKYVFKCTNTKNFTYSCEEFFKVTTNTGTIGVFDIDIEIARTGEVAILIVDTIYYYTQDGTLIRTFPIDGEYFNLALGPNNELFVSYLSGGDYSTVLAYDSSGRYLYSLELNMSAWDMFVDRLGILYIATYSEGVVLMYAPQYIVNQGAGRQVAMVSEPIEGFNVRRVKTVRLKD